MADRYWRGGTGTWSATNTANWSTTSGGAGGASVPTAADNVFFDANSNTGTAAFTVTMSISPRVCNDITISTDGTMTLAGSNIGLTVSGSLTFPATLFTRSYTGVTTFNATTTGKTITTNGKTFGDNVVFDGVGGGWTLNGAISLISYSVIVTNGTFNTGGYNITAGSLSSANSNTRTINLSTSTITLNSLNAVTFSPSTNLTLNAGSSQITSSVSAPVFEGGGLTFGGVSFTNSAKSSLIITGANTFSNLSITSRSTAIGITKVTFNANQTISGTFTVTNSLAASYRTMIASDVLGTQRTLTVNTLASMRDVDFRDIVAAGASASWSGTRFGDCGGNSNINFNAAKTVYLVPATVTINWGATSGGCWAASGSSAVSTDFPLAQDTAVINESASVSSLTINADYNIGTLNVIRPFNGFSFVISSNPTVYGDFSTAPNTSFFTSGGTTTFAGRTTQAVYIPSTFYSTIEINSPTGTVTLSNNISWSNDFGTRLVTLTSGTLNLNGKTLFMFGSASGSTFQTAAGTKNITFNGGTIQCTTFDNAAPTNFTTTQGTSEGTIELTSNNFGTGNFYGGSATYNCAIKNSAGYLYFFGSNTIQTISNSNRTTIFGFVGSNTVTNWNVTGSAGNIVTISGGTLSKASGVVSSDYLNIQNSTATGGATWYAGANSTDSGGNTGWIFTAPPSGGYVAGGQFMAFF
jgi:hypothetical protein